MHVSCPDCGGRGTLYFPKSHLPAVTKSVDWSGHYVKIKTIPSSVSVKIIDPETGEYRDSKWAYAFTDTYHWYCTSGKSCPIIFEFNGKEVKVLPYDSKGKDSKGITVNFTSGNPVVTGGTKVD